MGFMRLPPLKYVGDADWVIFEFAYVWEISMVPGHQLEKKLNDNRMFYSSLWVIAVFKIS